MTDTEASKVNQSMTKGRMKNKQKPKDRAHQNAILKKNKNHIIFYSFLWSLIFWVRLSSKAILDPTIISDGCMTGCHADETPQGLRLWWALDVTATHSCTDGLQAIKYKRKRTPMQTVKRKYTKLHNKREETSQRNQTNGSNMKPLKKSTKMFSEAKTKLSLQQC